MTSATKPLPGYLGTAGLGATIVDYGTPSTTSSLCIASIAFITFLLLMGTFRSILLPLKAVVLNLISLAAVMGLATWFWQEGKAPRPCSASRPRVR